MGKLKAQHVKDLRAFNVKVNIFDLVNEQLSLHNLGHLEIESIKFRPSAKSNIEAFALRPSCPDGQSLQLVCTLSGKCEMKCM